MKKFLQKICIFGLLTGAVLSLVPSTASVYADGNNNQEAPTSENFLGLVPWYDGLLGKNGEIMTVKQDCTGVHGDCATLTFFIWTIVFNVLNDLSVIAAYLVIGFIIWGGYQYMLSRGSVDKAMNGKKTITTAVIGLIIVMCANVIFNVIKFVMLSQKVSTAGITVGDVSVNLPTISANSVILNAIQWVIGIGGLIALIFVVYGAVVYVTSRGEPDKIQTAKRAILYAMIGLVIVALAQTITSFVASNIRNARDNNSGQSQTITIAKE